MENSQSQQISSPQKRNTAYQFRIGTILSSKQVVEAERLKHVEIEGKNIIRVNVIANITEKYTQEGEKKFGSITLDDGTGQIKAKAFGEDVDRLFSLLNMGDTILLIGLLRVWNNELYITPEIIRKKEPEYLLVRKLETESSEIKNASLTDTHGLKDKIIEMVKAAESTGGVDIEKIILELKEHPNTINQEIKKLLEDGIAYEPRPGRLRYLG